MLNAILMVALTGSALQAAPMTPAECPALAKSTVQAIFTAGPGEPVALQPVRIARDAVLAEEIQHLGDATWRTSAPVEITEAPRHLFPAGSVLTLMRTPHGRLKCFMNAAVSGEDPRGRTGTVTCLADSDGDGGLETAQLMDVPGGTIRALRLAAPVSIESVHPRESATEPFFATRRVRVASFAGNRARLVVEHRFVAGEQGPGFIAMPALTRNVRLQAGEVERVGGLDFRIERGAGGWTATPLQDRFPTWVAFTCDNEAIVGDGATGR